MQKELETSTRELDSLRYRQVERAQYEVELAKRRYLQVDPDNRLVAASLEADWNEKLQALATAEKVYERQRREDSFRLDQEKRAQMLALAADFPKLWNDPTTPMRERKRMLRLLIEDVTLRKESGKIAIHVRFRGGATRSLELPPLQSGQANTTAPEVVKEVDRLSEEHPDDKVAELLNEQGLKSGRGQTFSRITVSSIRYRYRLKSYFERLRERGMLSSDELAQKLGVKPDTIRSWRRRGLICGVKVMVKNCYLYQPPDKALLARLQKKKSRNNRL